MSKHRRSFLKKLAGGLIGASVAPQLITAGEHEVIELGRLARYGSPNDRIRLGAIGMGIQGFANCRSALRVPGVELAAVCDLYDGHLQSSKEQFNKDLFTTRDYREVLQRSDIDAVIISTPDHWHDHISIAAMEAGKAVYCEKPMVHHLEEGHAVIAAQKKTGQVFQVGSQRVSSPLYAKAKELFESGVLGRLVLAEAWTDRHSALGAWQYSIPPDASPKTVDWEAFLGDAPKRPFDKVRFFRWRNYTDYGTGMAGDLYVHLFSGLHTVTSSLGPERIFTTGGLRYWDDGRDVPDLQVGVFDYPETDAHPAFNVQLRCNFVDGGGGSSGLRLVGTDAMMDIGWNSLTVYRNPLDKQPGYGGWDTFGTFTEEMQKEYEAWYRETYGERRRPEKLEPIEFRLPQGSSDHVDHWTTFISAMREGTPIVEDAAFGLRAAGPSLAANLSYFQQAPVEWDPVGMRVRGA